MHVNIIHLNCYGDLEGFLFPPSIFINKGDGFRAVQLLRDSTVRDISSKHNKSAAQVLLRWGVQNNLGD